MSSRILSLDSQGQPNKWISYEDAITYHAKNLVAYQLGEGSGDVVFRGGENRATGRLSTIQTAPIIAVKGYASQKRMHKAPSLTNRELFRRDRHMCAYCGKTFSELKLTRDHVIPTSKGGKDVWTNVVTACERCNHKKDCQLLDECGMKLLYVPYTPNRAEALILESRNILAEATAVTEDGGEKNPAARRQVEYLKAFWPDHSRLWEELARLEAEAEAEAA